MADLIYKKVCHRRLVQIKTARWAVFIGSTMLRDSKGSLVSRNPLADHLFQAPRRHTSPFSP